MKSFNLVFVVALTVITLTITESAVVPRKNVKPRITQGGADPDPEVNAKREFVKLMMKDAWDDYVRYAWGENELRPISQTGSNKLSDTNAFEPVKAFAYINPLTGQDGGIYGDSKIGATIIDSLDTLYIMEYMDELQKGRDWMAENFNFSTVNTTVSLFEVNIRIVGGFVTAFILTGDQLYADLAYDVGKRLLPAFDTPSGIPYGRINPATGQVNTGSSISLAELGTLHLEFIALSDITGDPIFAEKVLKIQQHMNTLEKPNGLYYSTVNSESGAFVGSHVSMGGGADSFYEYLLKAYIQSGGKDTLARQMYDEAVDGFVKNDLVRTSQQSHLLFIGEQNNGVIENIGSHLECFAGAMFALGSVTDPAGEEGQQERDMEIGRNFTNTCHESYIRSQTHIGPETFRFTDNAEAIGVSPGDKAYILRPEVIESYFIMYRLTNDSKYRDWGWDAAQSIQKYCKAGAGRGYSGLRDVYNENPSQDDVQQTFFLAETLKYLYLLFSAPELINLDQWVFNTECHPLPIAGAGAGRTL